MHAWIVGGCLELQAFDEDYLKRLRAGDAATCDHFVAYFSQFLRVTDEGGGSARRPGGYVGHGAACRISMCLFPHRHDRSGPGQQFRL